MKARLLKDLKPVDMEVDELIVFDRFGDPLIIAVQLGDGQYLVAHRGDADFNTQLQLMGLAPVRTDIEQGPSNPRTLLI